MVTSIGIRALLALLLAGAGALAAAPDTTDIDLKAALAKGGYRQVLLSRTSGGAWIATATIDTIAARLLVDHRAPYTFLDGAALRKHGYKPLATKRDVTFGGAREPLYTIILVNFALGELNLDSAAFSVTNIAEVVRAAELDPEEQIAGVIGGDWLRRSDAVIDLANDRMFIRKPISTISDTLAVKPAPATPPKKTTAIGKLEEKLREREVRKKQSGSTSQPARQQEPADEPDSTTGD
jgi:hypothetical protein